MNIYKRENTKRWYDYFMILLLLKWLQESEDFNEYVEMKSE